MKKTQIKKKSAPKIKEVLKVIELPSDNSEMDKYLDENRVEINEMIVNNMDYAIKKRMSAVEIFSFKGSKFVVLVNREDFKDNLENIFAFSLSKEHFEVCGKAKKVIDKIDRFSCFFEYKKINNKYVKNKTFKQ